MLRFIMCVHEANPLGITWNDYYTLDINVPELEEAISRGGRDEVAFEKHSLIGIEVLAGDINNE